MLTGVARYIQEHEPWAIYLKPAGVEKSLPELAARLARRRDHRRRLRPGDARSSPTSASRSSTWSACCGARNVPLVHTNDHSVGRLGAEHLLERGFRNFGFIEYPEQFWSVDRRKGFQRVVEAHGFACDVYQLPWPAPGLGRAGRVGAAAAAASSTGSSGCPSRSAS